MCCGAKNKRETSLAYLRWVSIGVAAKLFTTVGVLRPRVAMLLSPFHASCQNLVHISRRQPASTYQTSVSCNNSLQEAWVSRQQKAEHTCSQLVRWVHVITTHVQGLTLSALCIALM